MSNNRSRNEENAAGSHNTSLYNYSGDNRIYGDGRGRTAHRVKVRFVKLLDVIMVSIPFILAW